MSQNSINQWKLSVIAIATALLLTSFNSIAGSKYNQLIVSKVMSVYDGDTFRVNINSLPALIGKNIPIRVARIDTPEIKGKCQTERKLAITARDFVRNLLSNAKTIQLKNVSRGKYFRIVADVYIDGNLLSKQLLDKKLGYSYYGNKKSSWCN